MNHIQYSNSCTCVENAAMQLEKGINELDYIMSGSMPDGSIRRIYKGGVCYMMKPSQDRFYRVKNISNQELKDIEMLIRNTTQKVSRDLQRLLEEEKMK